MWYDETTQQVRMEYSFTDNQVVENYWDFLNVSVNMFTNSQANSLRGR
jgi:hypothetical protein